jgi:hypothetical protein
MFCTNLLSKNKKLTRKGGSVNVTKRKIAPRVHTIQLKGKGLKMKFFQDTRISFSALWEKLFACIYYYPPLPLPTLAMLLTPHQPLAIKHTLKM